MLARIWKVGTIKIKIYQDVVDCIKDTAYKDFDQLFPYYLKFTGEDNDFYYYEVELPFNMVDVAMKEIKEEIDSWIRAYKEREKKDKREQLNKDEFIWE